MSENGVQFPGKTTPAPLPVPPLHDMIQGGTKVCPFMPPSILMMPVEDRASKLAVQQQQAVAFVRHFTPCVKDRCVAWALESDAEGEIPGTGFCRLIQK